MQLNEGPLKRRDAEGAEERRGEELFLYPFSASLRALCVSALDPSQPASKLGYSSAEKDQSQPLEDLSPNCDWVKGRDPRSFLCALRVSAVPWHTPTLNGYGLALSIKRH